MVASVAVAGTPEQAEAASSQKIVFESNRTTGPGVNNPTGDREIFEMNPDGTGLKQLTFNQASDFDPVLSADGKKIAYDSEGVQTSNPEGDTDVYRMSALDGTHKKNLSNNGDGVDDYYPVFSPDGTRIAYGSGGVQTSNLEGDWEVYRLNVLDGSGKKNLTNTGADVNDYDPVFSSGGKRIAYESSGVQTSNPEGDSEVYAVNASDGKDKKNLTNSGADVGEDLPLFSPGGKKIAYESYGKQTSNPEGDYEVYRMSALDGSGKRNLSNNGADVNDSAPVVFSPDGKKIAYNSYGKQTSNPEGDIEMYRMSALDGSGKKNLSNNGSGASDYPGGWGVLGR